jgi:septum formation topological specificity factor MinE
MVCAALLSLPLTLQFSSAQCLNIPIRDILQIEQLIDLGLHVALILARDDLRHRTLHTARDRIDILRLDDRLDVILEELREEILQIATAEVDQNLLEIDTPHTHKRERYGGWREATQRRGRGQS